MPDSGEHAAKTTERLVAQRRAGTRRSRVPALGMQLRAQSKSRPMLRIGAKWVMVPTRRSFLGDDVDDVEPRLKKTSSRAQQVRAAVRRTCRPVRIIWAPKHAPTPSPARIRNFMRASRPNTASTI